MLASESFEHEHTLTEQESLRLINPAGAQKNKSCSAQPLKAANALNYRKSPSPDKLPISLFAEMLQLLNKLLEEQALSLGEIKRKLGELIKEKEFRKKQAFRFSKLTPREREVLSLLAQGLSNKAIAARLFISLETVKHHRKIIKNKLEARSIADFIRYARAFKLCKQLP